MKILNAAVRRARRDRDFDRVEALVSLLIRDTPTSAPRVETIRASVPSRARQSERSLRERLIEDASSMAVLFHSTRTAAPMRAAA